MAAYCSGRTGWAMLPASSGNCTVRSLSTSSMRLTARADASPAMSMLNSWSRKTVRPSFSDSWNQSRQVMRLPVQLWKYSCATMLSMAKKSSSVAVSALASTYLVLNRFSPLFSIAPKLKSSTATIMKRSRSSARPKRASSHTTEAISEFIACSVLPRSARFTYTCSRWSRPARVRIFCSRATRSAATSANR